jgi:hypothetical protein
VNTATKVIIVRQGNHPPIVDLWGDDRAESNIVRERGREREQRERYKYAYIISWKYEHIILSIIYSWRGGRKAHLSSTSGLLERAILTKSTFASRTLLRRAKAGARGNATANIVTYPNYMRYKQTQHNNKDNNKHNNNKDNDNNKHNNKDNNKHNNNNNNDNAKEGGYI